jgi:hypothetical protein
MRKLRLKDIKQLAGGHSVVLSPYLVRISVSILKLEKERSYVCGK